VFSLKERTHDYSNKEHFFTLFNTDQGVYRIEAYSGVYIPRISGWDTWDQDLYNLLVMQPSTERVTFWEGIFSVRLTKRKDSHRLFEVKLIV
jgi:hypothetical protein